MSTSAVRSVKLEKLIRGKRSHIWVCTIYQSLLPTISSYYNIPISIIYIILAFYYEYEQFEKCQSGLELSDDSETVTVQKE